MLFLVTSYDAFGDLLGVRNRYGKVELVEVVVSFATSSAATDVTSVILVIDVPVIDGLLLESLEGVAGL
jgi:hypothetical protein